MHQFNLFFCSILLLLICKYHDCDALVHVVNHSYTRTLSRNLRNSEIDSPVILQKNDRRTHISRTTIFETRSSMELHGADSTGPSNGFDVLEKQMLAKIQEERDVKRIKDAVLGTVEESIKKRKNSEPPSTLSIALAAGSAVGLTSLAALHIPILSLGAFAATTYVAQRDPIKDEDLLEGDLSGPLSRIIGRATLSSIEKTKPVLQAALRTAIDSKGDLAQNENDDWNIISDSNTNTANGAQPQKHFLDQPFREYTKYTTDQLHNIARNGGDEIGGIDLMPSIPLSVRSSADDGKRKV
jgi:hypothetical protein